jgi:hypothetical protein
MSCSLQVANVYKIRYTGCWFSNRGEQFEELLNGIAGLQYSVSDCGEYITIEGNEENIALIRTEIEQLRKSPEERHPCFAEDPDNLGDSGEYTNEYVADCLQSILDNYDKGDSKNILDGDIHLHWS